MFADMTRRTTLRLTIALVILLVALPTVGYVTLNNSPTAQQWVADHWVPGEDDGPQ